MLGSGKGSQLLALDMPRSGRWTAVVERRVSTKAGWSTPDERVLHGRT
jgi:hypothetical protein